MRLDFAGVMRDADKVNFFRPWARSCGGSVAHPLDNAYAPIGIPSSSPIGSESSDGGGSATAAAAAAALLDRELAAALTMAGGGPMCQGLANPRQLEELLRMLSVVPECWGGLAHTPGQPSAIGYDCPALGWPAAYAADYANWMSDYQEAVRRLNCQEAMAKQQKKNRPKKFKCDICETAFSNNGQLKGHLRIHTGERPFRCQHFGCGKSFTRNEELTRHKRIHTGLRPYACAICGKGFGRKDHLKKHIRTHGRQTIRLAHQEFFAFAPFVGYDVTN